MNRSYIVISLMITLFAQSVDRIAYAAQERLFLEQEPGEVFQLPQAEKRVELHKRYLPIVPKNDSNQRYKDALTGFGYILTGNIRRLDHLAMPKVDHSKSLEVTDGIKPKMRLLFGTRLESNHKLDLILFDRNLQEWY